MTTIALLVLAGGLQSNFSKWENLQIQNLQMMIDSIAVSQMLAAPLLWALQRPQLTMAEHIE